MKVLMIVAASLALALSGCHRDQNAAGGSSVRSRNSIPASAIHAISSSMARSG